MLGITQTKNAATMTSQTTSARQWRLL